jgi:hypothetical protein
MLLSWLYIGQPAVIISVLQGILLGIAKYCKVLQGIARYCKVLQGIATQVLIILIQM